MLQLPLREASPARRPQLPFASEVPKFAYHLHRRSSRLLVFNNFSGYSGKGHILLSHREFTAAFEGLSSKSSLPFSDRSIPGDGTTPESTSYRMPTGASFFA